MKLKWTVLIIFPILLSSCIGSTYKNVNNSWQITEEIALENPYSFRLSTNDQYLINISKDKELNIYDDENNVIFTLQLHHRPVERLWSPNDQFLIMEFLELDEFILIDINNIKADHLEISGKIQVWSPDSSQFIVKSNETFYIYDVHLKIIKEINIEVPAEIKKVIYWMDDDLLLISGYYLVRINNDGSTSLVDTFEWTLPEYMNYNATNQTILYVEDDSLWIYDILGKNRDKISKHYGRTYWSPDLENIVINTGVKLYIYNLEAGKTTNVLNHSINAQGGGFGIGINPSVSVKWLDNERIAFDDMDGTKGYPYRDVLVVYNIKNKKIEFAHEFEEMFLDFNWSPSDNALYYSQKGSPLYRLEITEESND